MLGMKQIFIYYLRISEFKGLAVGYQSFLLRFPFIINFITMMKLKNVKYTFVNKIKIAFNDAWKSDIIHLHHFSTGQNNMAKINIS
jgi:hypothetical protein